MWRISYISPFNFSPLLFVSVSFHHLIPPLLPFSLVALFHLLLGMVDVITSSVSVGLFCQDKGSPLGCALLSPFISFSPHRGGCHSSVLPNKQAEGKGDKRGGGGRDLGTQDGNIEGETEDRN